MPIINKIVADFKFFDLKSFLPIEYYHSLLITSRGVVDEYWLSLGMQNMPAKGRLKPATQ